MANKRTKNPTRARESCCELAAAVAALTARVEQLERQRVPVQPHDQDLEVLRAIATVVGDDVFTARQVLDIQKATPTLAAVIRNRGLQTVAPNGLGRKIGKLLARNVDRRVDDHQLRRVGEDAAGVLWHFAPTIVVFMPHETHENHIDTGDRRGAHAIVGP